MRTDRVDFQRFQILSVQGIDQRFPITPAAGVLCTRVFFLEPCGLCGCPLSGSTQLPTQLAPLKAGSLVRNPRWISQPPTDVPI